MAASIMFQAHTGMFVVSSARGDVLVHEHKLNSVGDMDVTEATAKAKLNPYTSFIVVSDPKKRRRIA